MKRILAFIIVACLAVFVFIPVGNQSVSAAETSVFDREDKFILYLKISYRRTPRDRRFLRRKRPQPIILPSGLSRRDLPT